MILVTGCAGFIGSNLCQSLLKEGKSVLGIDNFDPFYDISIKRKNLSFLNKFKTFIFLPVDITKKSQVSFLFSQYSFSSIVHLAARPGVSASFSNPLLYEHNNVYGTLMLLEEIKKLKISCFIFGSSSSVYGGSVRGPFSENEVSDFPLSPYAISKKCAEIYCQMYHDIYGLPVTILRLFTVYGPRVRPDMAIMKFIKAIEKGETITIYNRGEVERDYTYIEDIILGIKKALEKKLAFEIINLGNSHPIKIKQVVKLIEKKIGKKAKVKSAPLPRGEMAKTWADIKKARRLLSWKPKVGIEEGVEKLTSWYYGKK